MARSSKKSAILFVEIYKQPTTTFGYPLLEEITWDGHERTKNGRKEKQKKKKKQITKHLVVYTLVIDACFKACASITGEI